MASSQEVDNIEHWFAVNVFKSLSVHTVQFSTGVTIEISICAVMSDDHDVVSGTFLQCKYVSVSYKLILQRQIQRYINMNNVYPEHLILYTNTTNSRDTIFHSQRVQRENSLVDIQKVDGTMRIEDLDQNGYCNR